MSGEFSWRSVDVADHLVEMVTITYFCVVTIVPIGLAMITVPVIILLWLRVRSIVAERQIVMGATNSILMSSAEYVGGHPLLPLSGSVVLGLSRTHITIYHRKRKPSTITHAVEIPLRDVVQTTIGKPKTAREVYDEEYHRTIDVHEGSPFINVIFDLEGKSYVVSLQRFESYTVHHLRESSGWGEKVLAFLGQGSLKHQSPQDWQNLITTLKYEIDKPTP